ncbi:hypothetical protein ACFE04_021913 [Oxalis oulophora]
MKNSHSSLPPGFRFHPTDEELILHYLKKKLSSTHFSANSIIADVDIYKFDPWELPARAAFGEKEWYFFSPRDRKYPNGARPNRAAGSGYWKATGTDKIIVAPPTMAGAIQETIGVKKALVFYKGKPPKGVKTNWIMHEYRLTENSTYNHKPLKNKDFSMRLDDWVLCRIYRKSQSVSLATTSVASDQEEEEEQFVQELKTPISQNNNNNNNNTLMTHKSCSFSNLLDAMDYSMLSSFLSDNQANSTGFEFYPTTNNYESSLDNQSFFNNGNVEYSYLHQKLPPLTNVPGPNSLKRQYPDEELFQPSKKLVNSCSFINNNNNHQADVSQYRISNYF